MLDNYKEVIEALEATNEQIVSHRQNEVLQILTIISFIMLPLFVITGIFGMNVIFPGQGTSGGFWAICGLMLASVLGMVAYFRYKRWL
jgi:magnesium transporter